MKNKKSRIYKQLNWYQKWIQGLEEITQPIAIEIVNEIIGKKCMWKAKNRATGEEYGHAFSSAIECQEYINKELKYLNKFYKLVEEEKNELFSTNYNGANIIQCYNKTDKRWADGFDY